MRAFWSNLISAIGEKPNSGTAALSGSDLDQQIQLTELMELEPRVLYSASPLELSEPQEHIDSQTPFSEAATTESFVSVDVENWLVPTVNEEPNPSLIGLDSELFFDEQAQPNNLVIVDSSVDGYELLIDDIRNNQTDALVFVLDSRQDGVAQITQFLSGQSNVRSVHIVSHGTDGEVNLGATDLSANSLAAYAGEIASWSSALSVDADILFYGCNLAASESGQELIESLGTLTGADIAASDDLTGHESLGGDWDLEFVYGELSTSIIVSADFQQAWFSSLAAPVAVDDSYSINKDGTLTINGVGVLANDTDADLDPLTAALVGDVSNGALSLLNDGTFTYTPTVGFTGTDLFTYQSNDGTTNSNLATVTIEVGVDVTGGSPSVWFSTLGNADTDNGVNWSDTDIIQVSDPNFALEPGTTTGTVGPTGFSAPVDVRGFHLVHSTTVMVGDTQVQQGDILFAIDVVHDFGGFTADRKDIVHYRPDSLDDYSSGTYSLFLDNGIHDGVTEFNVHGISLIERNVTVGGQALTQGTLVVAHSTPALDDNLYTVQVTSTEMSVVPTTPGTQTNARQDFIDGDALGFANEQIQGIEVLEEQITMGGTTIAEGSILLTLNIPGSGTLNVGSNSLTVNGEDIFYLTVGGTVNTTGTAATATHLFEGNDLGLNSGSGAGAKHENINGLSLINSLDVNEAPTSDAGGSYAINEGDDSLVLDGTASNDPEGLALTYEWDLNGDLVYGDVTGATTGVSWATLTSFGIDDDNPSITIGLRVTDDIGQFSISTTTLAVANVAPTLITTGASSVNDGSAYTLNLSTIDPGNELISSWTINWGDGAIDTFAGNPTSVTHAYNGEGMTYNILASMTDGDGTFMQNEMLVTSYGTGDSIYRFAPTTGAFLEEFATGDGLNDPIELVIGPDGNLYVSGEFSDNVLRYNAVTGAFIDEFVVANSGGLNSPGGLTFGSDGNLYVASFRNDKVLRYDGTTGAFIDEFVTAGSGGLDRAYGLLFGPDGNLYVNSYNNNQVLRYDGMTGAFIDEFVSAGSGGLSTPEQMIFGPDGNLYIASFDTNEVLRYNGSTGLFMDAFVTAGLGGLDKTTGLAFGPDGNLYVADLQDGVIIRYNGDTGAYIDEYVSSGLSTPNFVNFLPQQQVTVNGVNDAPVLIDTVVTLGSVDEDAGSPVGAVGTLISSLADLDSPIGGQDNVSDPDVSPVTGIAITAADTTNGTWYFSTDNGAVWNALGVVSDSTARVLAADASTRIYFQGSSDFEGAINSALTFRAWDQTDGNVNGTGGVNTTTNGGMSAFSVATDVAAIVVNSVNDVPVLANNQLTITEGNTVILSSANFSATDVDNPNPSLTFTVSSVVDGQFELGAASGVAITSFSQLQITNGDVVFVDNGDEFAPSYDVTVDDGSLNDGPTAATITFTGDNDAPVLANNQLTIAEGNTAILSSTNFSATDIDDSDPSLTFTVSSVVGGQFELGASSGVAITSFTQLQITNGDVVFVDNGDAFAPSYDVTVGDGSLNDGSTAATITFTSDNAPVLANNQLTITEGNTVILSSANFSASDVDNPDPSLTFTASSVVGGQFELRAAPGAAITSFTQLQITNGDVVFVDNGDEFAPSYDVAVDDGSLSEGPTAATVTFTGDNDAPLLANNQLMITEGNTVILSSANFSASDVDNPDPSLTFTVSSVVSGQFELGVAPGVVTTSFTQLQITNGDVVFVDNGDEFAPSYDVTVGDGSLSDGPTAATITFTGDNDAPALANNQLTITEGNTVILSGANFSASDVDDSDPSLTFTVSSVVGGQFELGASPGVAITSFTQAQLDAAEIIFVDDGDELAPSYDVSVGDGSLVDGPYAATINFTNINDAPVGADDAYVISQTETLDGDGLLLNDMDVDGDPLTATLDTLPTNGTVILNPDGSFMYSPDTTFSGTDSFTYILSDGMTTSDPVTVLVTVVGPRIVSLPADSTPTTEEEDDDEKNTPVEVVVVEPKESEIVKSPKVVPVFIGKRANGVSDSDEASFEKADGTTAEILAAIKRSNIQAYSSLNDTITGPRSQDESEMEFMDRTGWFWKALDQNSEQMELQAKLPQVLLGASAAFTSGITVGYLVWVIKGGQIAAAVMANLPAWRFIDLLPILNGMMADADDGETLETIIQKGEEDLGTGSPATA